MFDRQYHYHYDNPQNEVWLRTVESKIDLILCRMEFFMASLADLTAAVARNTDAENAALEYLKGISQQLKDAQAANDPAALDEVIKSIDANTAKAAAAIVQGTPST